MCVQKLYTLAARVDIDACVNVDAAACVDAGQHNAGNRPGSERAQKSLDKRAANMILRGARELLLSRAAELKQQAADVNKVCCSTAQESFVTGLSGCCMH